MSNLNVGDVVKVYDAHSIIRGSATVLSGTSVSFNLDIYNSFGILYVSTQSIGKTESTRTEKHF